MQDARRVSARRSETHSRLSIARAFRDPHGRAGLGRGESRRRRSARELLSKLTASCRRERPEDDRISRDQLRRLRISDRGSRGNCSGKHRAFPEREQRRSIEWTLSSPATAFSTHTKRRCGRCRHDVPQRAAHLRARTRDRLDVARAAATDPASADRLGQIHAGSADLAGSRTAG